MAQIGTPGLSPPPGPARSTASAAGLSTPDAGLFLAIRRVVALSAIAGLIEVVGYMDFGGIYPGIMTGNTVQLGSAVATSQWARAGLIGFAVGLFFAGGIISSLIKRRLHRPAIELILMAVVLLIASLVRMQAHARLPFELPLLALAMGMQGETLSKFGGVAIQTIVVTNNMVKFTDAVVGRYLSGSRKARAPHSVPSLEEVLLPGLAWFSYSFGAGVGAVSAVWFKFPLLLPAALLVLTAWDLLAEKQRS